MSVLDGRKNMSFELFWGFIEKEIDVVWFYDGLKINEYIWEDSKAEQILYDHFFTGGSVLK